MTHSVRGFYTVEQIEALAQAMWQVLDDMGKTGQSVCLATKAEARLAFEPFFHLDPPDEDLRAALMSLEDARAVIDEVER